MKYFDLARADFAKLVEGDPLNVKAHFYLGKILNKKGESNDAVLHFEQVVKYNAEEFLSANALFEIAKLRIKQKDFYEAYYNLKRVAQFDFRSRKLSEYKLFTEGVLYLMKRKVKKGVALLS